MPNIKSAIRKVKRIKKQSEVNKFRKNRYKQAVKKIQKLIEKKDVCMADAEQVKLQTGFSIGGVAPVAHLIKLKVLIDKSLKRFPDVFGAAGHPNCVFKISYRQLIKITNGSEEEISEWENQKF